MNTMAPPTIRPARAPALLDRFQNRDSSIVGPNVAPKPAQAKETTRKTELLGFQARTMAIMAMPITVALAMIMFFLASILMPRKSCIRSWDTEEAAASSWESAVDMVAARIPARITPAIRAKKKPCWLIRSAILMMMVSESELVSSSGILPVRETL